MTNNYEAMRKGNENVTLEIFDACLRAMDSSSDDATIVSCTHISGFGR